MPENTLLSLPAVVPLPPDLMKEAMALVWRVFQQFESPDYVPEGIETFRRFINCGDMAERQRTGEYTFWCARTDGTLAGVLGLREPAHVSLLFVDAPYHRRGTATRLMEKAVRNAVSRGAEEMTVNSSPYAVGFYRRFGFIDDSGEQTRDGIRFTPMTLTLSKITAK